MPKRIYSVTGHEGEKAFTRTTQTMKYRYAAVLLRNGEPVRALSYSATADGANKSGANWLKCMQYPDFCRVNVFPVTLIKGTED